MGYDILLFLFLIFIFIGWLIHKDNWSRLLSKLPGGKYLMKDRKKKDQ